jgi:DNA-binding PucR family transcriptional regulator
MSTHDLEHGTEYGRSITCWLEAVGDVGRAAGVLGIHANTLRYRLRRATELFGASLDHPGNRLAGWMQLRLIA